MHANNQKIQQTHNQKTARIQDIPTLASFKSRFIHRMQRYLFRCKNLVFPPQRYNYQLDRKLMRALGIINRSKRGISHQKIKLEHCTAEWNLVTSQQQTSPNVILYLHGGAYVSGSPQTHRNICSSLAQQSGHDLLALDYRLAPEHPYPAALDDSVHAFQYLLAQGYAPEHIHFAGDSAGGGLAVSTLLRLREQNIQLPRSACLFSPWTDLTHSGASHQTKRALDPMLQGSQLSIAAALYCPETSLLADPYISPLFADLHSLPPLLIQVGTNEVLLDDSKQLAHRAALAGVDVHLELWQDMYHVFHMSGEMLREAKQALCSAAKFINSHKTDQ